MNEGGKLLVTGQFALQGAWDQFLYNPLGPTPPKPLCPQNQALGQGARVALVTAAGHAGVETGSLYAEV